MRSDGIAVEGHAFVRGVERLNLDTRKSFEDLPDKSDITPLVAQAEFLTCQTSNPFIDLTAAEMFLISYAASFLRWVQNPTKQESWEELFACREWYCEVKELGDFREPE